MIHELHPPTILFLAPKSIKLNSAPKSIKLNSAPKSIKLNSAPKNNQPTEEYHCSALQY
jgi:hypothetical protein